ncbi:Shikimate 5-dehydrogenase [Chitinispirillum alkaliphilum]|nr:Shikimate 5-dehydrogenase [Chitinispirillum alkaliphilum]
MESFITGASRTICLLGNPVSHSISPQIHNHAIHQLGLPFVYIPVKVESQQLGCAVEMIRSDSFIGANVTIPHKQALIHYCDELSELSVRMGTVNTLYKRGGMLCGTTTDPEGFLRALSHTGHQLKDDSVIILGNGGTARTLAFALAIEGNCREISIAGRSLQRAASLAQSVSEGTGKEVGALGLNGSEFEKSMKRSTLLVNCTSVGMKPNENFSPVSKGLLHSEMTVFDCIYNPSETLLLKEARLKGCRVANGLKMLLFQALASFKLWTGKTVPEDMYDMDLLTKLVEK